MRAAFKYWIAVAVATAGIAHAEPIARIPVEDIRPLMLAALDAPDGAAHGVLVGKLADAISRRFASAAPIIVDVSTEKRLAQTGCSRLKISIAQDDVHLPGKATPQHQTFEMGINYCRDGLPPKSP